MTVELDVVIPVRDVARYLGEAIDSVVAQDVGTRLIVVDAGSVQPIALPAGVDAELIRSDEPLTAGAARTLGATHASADWLAFLDADDIWPEDSRRTLIDAAIGDGADGAIGMMASFPADSESAARLRVPDGLQPALIAGGMVIRRAAWDAVGHFDPQLRTGEFIEWFNRFGADHRVTRIDATVLRRRVHLESTTARQINDRSDYLKVVRRWMSQNGS